MKKILSKTAFSLLELIIATSLVVVVLMGIFAINSVLSNNNQDYGQRYMVKSDTQTTLNHILNNASLAVGSATTIIGTGYVDQGIEIGSSGVNGDPNSHSFCIHQAAGNNIFSNETSGDIWLCYTWIPPTGSATDYQIQYCTMPYTTSTVYRGAASCNSSVFTTTYCPSDTPTNCSGPTYLGMAQSNPTVSFPTTPGATGVGVFSLSITNCLDNFQTRGENCGTSNNPQVTVSGSVVPSQEGLPQS